MNNGFKIEEGDPPTLRANAARFVARLTARPALDVAAALGNLLGPHNLSRLPIPLVNWAVDRVVGAVMRPTRGTGVARVDLGAVCGEWIEPASAEPLRAILYFHGGGMMFGGLGTHRRMVTHIAGAARATALHVGYRMAPRCTFSDALGDAVAGYRHLLAEGYTADKIIVAGDSAGGMIALAVVRSIIDAGLPRPAAVVALAPQVDMRDEVRAHHPNRRRDPYIPAAAMSAIAKVMVANNPSDLARTPLAVRVDDYPPVLIQASSIEVLLADATAMAHKLADANVPCTLQIWDNQMHVFQAAADVLPEARSALVRMGEFVDGAVADAGRADHQATA